MELLLECLLTLLAGFGLALLVGVLFSRLLHPVSSRNLCLLLAGKGSGERLEGDLRGVIWLRSLGLLRCSVIIADAGLNEEGLELARHLTRRWSEVSLCPTEELGENLKRGQ